MAEFYREVIGIFGRTGLGKSHLLKNRILPKINRSVIFDPQHEYEGGVLCPTAATTAEALLDLKDLAKYRVIFQPDNDEDVQDFLEFMGTTTKPGPDGEQGPLNKFTLIAEEASIFSTSGHQLSPEIRAIMRYGRHNEISFIFINQRPSNIHKDMTAQAHVLISFFQDEPNDLDYMKAYNWSTPLLDLDPDKYEYAISNRAGRHGQHIIEKYLNPAI